jgi:hypothetical protein
MATSSSEKTRWYPQKGGRLRPPFWADILSADGLAPPLTISDYPAWRRASHKIAGTSLLGTIHLDVSRGPAAAAVPGRKELSLNRR